MPKSIPTSTLIFFHPLTIFTLFLISNIHIVNCQQKSLTLKLQKQHITIPNNSNYRYNFSILQNKSQINSLNFTLNHQIYNTIRTSNQYFDYFKNLTQSDLKCYYQSIYNKSYLYPCPFITNNQQILRTTSISNQLKIQNKTIQGINITQSYIVDNTPFPFPTGAFSYKELQITWSITLILFFDNQYKEIGIKLIIILGTLFVIYMVIIAVLVFRTYGIQKELLKRKPDYKVKRRISQLSRQNNDKKQQDQQSEIDNFQNIVHHQLAFRESRLSRTSRSSRQYNQIEDIPSLLSSQRVGIDSQVNLIRQQIMKDAKMKQEGEFISPIKKI